MGITEAKDEISPEMERIIRELKRLEEMSIHIGIQGLPGRDESGMEREGAPADILTIANVNEFGATIKAKNVKNLAIPIAKKAIGKSPLDFPGLFQEWLSVWMYQQEAEGNIPKKEKQSDRQQTQKAWPIQKTDSEKDRRY